MHVLPKQSNRFVDLLSYLTSQACYIIVLMMKMLAIVDVLDYFLSKCDSVPLCVIL